MADITVLKQINIICEFLIEEVPDSYEFESSMMIGFTPVTGTETKRINKKKLREIVESNKRIIVEYEKPVYEEGERKYNRLIEKVKQLNSEVKDKYHTDLILQYIKETEKQDEKEKQYVDHTFGTFRKG